MDKLKLVFTQRTDDIHVQLEGHPEIWACGKTIDDALGNWARTHQDRLNITLDFSRMKGAK